MVWDLLNGLFLQVSYDFQGILYKAIAKVNFVRTYKKVFSGRVHILFH